MGMTAVEKVLSAKSGKSAVRPSDVVSPDPDFIMSVMTDCVAVTESCDTGDELEVEFQNGLFVNATRGITREYPPIPDTLLEIVELGGNSGWLKRWWENQQKKSAA